MEETFAEAIEKHESLRKQFATDAVAAVHCDKCAAPAGARCLSKGGYFVKTHSARLGRFHQLIARQPCAECGQTLPAHTRDDIGTCDHFKAVR